MLIHVQDGQTPLFIASLKGHGAVVELLLQQHADVSISMKVIFHHVLADVLQYMTLVVVVGIHCQNNSLLHTCSKALCVETEINQ